MPKWTDKLKDILAMTAPTIGMALGGPLGATAGTVLARQLGQPPDTPPEVLEAEILKGDPDTLLKLKQAEIEFTKLLADNEIKLVELGNDERANARAREVAVGKDWVMPFLVITTTAGVFGVLFWIIKWGVPEKGEQVVFLIIGAILTAWTGIVAYYFGSSAGSAKKQMALDEALSQKR